MKNLSNRIKNAIIYFLEAANKRRKFVLALSCLVVFVTTYVLILPAFTLDADKAKDQGGIDVPEIAQEDDSHDKDAAAEDASDKDQDADEAQAKSGEDKSKDALDAKSDDSKDAAKDASDAKESDKSDAGKAAESESAEALSYEGKGFAVAVADKSSVLPGDGVRDVLYGRGGERVRVTGGHGRTRQVRHARPRQRHRRDGPGRTEAPVRGRVACRSRR